MLKELFGVREKKLSKCVIRGDAVMYSGCCVYFNQEFDRDSEPGMIQNKYRKQSVPSVEELSQCFKRVEVYKLVDNKPKREVLYDEN